MLWSFSPDNFIDPSAPGLTPPAADAARAALVAKADHEALVWQVRDAREALKRAPEEDSQAETIAQLAGEESPASTRAQRARDLDAATKRAEGADRVVRERLHELSRAIEADKEVICEAARKRVAAQEAKAGRLIAELREATFDIEADRGRRDAFERTYGHPNGTRYSEPDRGKRAQSSAKVAASIREMPRGNSLVDRTHSDTLLAALEAMLIPLEPEPVLVADARRRSEPVAPVETNVRQQESKG